MQAGTHGDELRRVADRLCDEFTDPDAPDIAGIGSTLGGKGGLTKISGTEDEALVRRLREALAGIASTLSAGTEHPPVHMIKTALDSIEYFIRGELASSKPERVLLLMPSFVFLVALSVSDQDRAIELSRRTTELIEERK